MHTHSWRTGEFHSHTRRHQHSRIVARTGHLLPALTGLDCQPRLPCERHHPNVAVATSPTRATHMCMAEVDDRACSAIAIRRLRSKRVRSQANQAVREIGTAQTVSSSISPDKRINVVKHRQKASLLFLSPAAGTFRSNLLFVFLTLTILPSLVASHGLSEESNTLSKYMLPLEM